MWLYTCELHRTVNKSTVFVLLVIFLSGMKTRPPVRPSVHPSITQASVTWSVAATSSCSLLTWLMEGPYLQEGTGCCVGRGLSRETNEAIRQSFVCPRAPSHQQLMRRERCSPFRCKPSFSSPTFPLFVSPCGGGGAVTSTPTDLSRRL